MNECSECRTETDSGLDYCAVCSRDLCLRCMEKGCCGNVPAISGIENDMDQIHAPDIGGEGGGGR